MNILEMEDMVKGLPDQVVAQYAQFPDAQVPQFLALSELQRRQDMRQRFQAQQQGMEPTVKDQILQGGIASAMPQGAPPMDQGMAPPMAPPQAMPQQAPAMMAGGGMVPSGIVRMQQGRAVPGNSDLVNPAYQQRLTALNAVERMGTGLPLNMDLISFVRTKTPNFDQLSPREQQMVLQAFEPQYMRGREISQIREQINANPEAASQILSDFVPAPTPAPTPAPAPVTTSAPVPTATVPPVNVPPPPAEDGGIGAFNRTPPASRAYPSVPEVVGLIQGLGADQSRPQEVTDYINLIRQQTEQGLPPPVDLGQFVTRAEERERSIREDARRQALGAALLQLGAGVASGEMASGLRGAGEQASQIMGQGRREAGQQQALAEQLRLRGAESSREAQVQVMNLSRDATKAIADIATSERQTQAQRELASTTLLTNFVSAMEKVAGDLDQQNQLNARSFATTATNLFESMVGPPTGFETPDQLAKRDEALRKAVTLAANMTGQDPEPVLTSLREGAPVTIQYKGKSYRFPNQKAADEFRRRTGE
jgi:hypothetical protein